MTEEIGSNDVLLGRGGQTNNHVGNKRFRSIVSEHQREYLAARKKEKVLIARRVVSIVQENGGRFLKRDVNSDSWVEVPNKRATEKTSQALREGLDVRNNTIRPSKMIRRRDADDDSTSVSDGRRNQIHAVVSGTVMSPLSPSVVSLASSSCEQQQQPQLHSIHAIPDLRDEYSHPMQPAFLHYQPPPINQSDVNNVCDV